MEYFANQDQRFNSFYFDLTLEKRAPGTCFSSELALIFTSKSKDEAWVPSYQTSSFCFLN